MVTEVTARVLLEMFFLISFGSSAQFSDFISFLQFFPTAEESIDYYNQKRCIDGKGLVLPSQIVSLFTLYYLLLKLH